MTPKQLQQLAALLANTRMHLVDVNNQHVALAQQTLASAIDLVRNARNPQEQSQ